MRASEGAEDFAAAFRGRGGAAAGDSCRCPGDATGDPRFLFKAYNLRSDVPVLRRYVEGEGGGGGEAEAEERRGREVFLGVSTSPLSPRVC